MDLDITISTLTLTLTSTAPTVIAPGEPFQLKWRLSADAGVQLLAPGWTGEGSLPPLPTGVLSGFPRTLVDGESLDMEVELFPGLPEEGYGWIQVRLPLLPVDGTEQPDLEWRHWLSVFPRENTGQGPSLSDRHRERLVGVVNADTRNGHIFLADYQLFFREYLHLDIPEAIVGEILEGLGLPLEGLPLPEEEFLDIARGLKTFFGLDRLELLPDGEDETGDDCYDFEHLAEQLPGEVDVF